MAKESMAAVETKGDAQVPIDIGTHLVIDGNGIATLERDRVTLERFRKEVGHG